MHSMGQFGGSCIVEGSSPQGVDKSSRSATEEQRDSGAQGQGGKTGTGVQPGDGERVPPTHKEELRGSVAHGQCRGRRRLSGKRGRCGKVGVLVAEVVGLEGEVDGEVVVAEAILVNDVEVDNVDVADQQVDEGEVLEGEGDVVVVDVDVEDVRVDE